MGKTKYFSAPMVLMLILILVLAMSDDILSYNVKNDGDTAYRNDVIGVYLQKLPPQSRIVEDQYLSDAFGFTVVGSEGRMLLRVAWRYRDMATQIERRVKEFVQAFPEFNLFPQPIRIGLHQGMMMTSVPGIDPSTYIYLVAYGRLYEIIYPEEKTEGRDMLTSLSFAPTARSPEELGLLKLVMI